jgi:hypothetical protein
MALNRGTRKATFLHLLETFAILGVLGGAGWGIYDALGKTPFEMLMNAIRLGFLGFVSGTVVGIVLGGLTVIYATIFR